MDVFVSFDYENDRHYKRLLEAWNKNPRFRFVFDDASSGEIDSNDVGRVKAALTTKIKDATHTLVIIGKYANAPHRDREKIGYRNWINFEVAQSVVCGNRIAAIKLDRENDSPEQLVGVNASWAYAFNEDAIIKALDSAQPAHR